MLPQRPPASDVLCKPRFPDAGLSLAFDTAQETHQNRRVAQHLFAEVLMTELDDVSEVDTAGPLRDFVVAQRGRIGRRRIVRNRRGVVA